MTNYVSFLRGVNVGGRQIKMTDLKDCYEKAGMSAVSTLLQSGNVIFSTNLASPESVQNTLEVAVSARFNYSAKIMVLPRSELKALVGAYPFDASDERFQHYLIFLRPGLASKLALSELEQKSDIDEIADGGNIVYWKVVKGMTVKSPFSKILTKPEFRDFHTVRNIKTVAKLIG